MNKPLFLFVARSASGKTTVANMLEKDGYKQIASYTTRPPRYEGEKEHIFISEEEYDKLENIVASTLYSGYRYCTTLEQIQNADIYVIDPDGVETLIKNRNLINREICIIYFEASVCNRIQRMMERGDSDTAIIGRLLMDEKNNWLEQLRSVVRPVEFLYPRTSLHVINADNDMQTVYNDVKTLIEIKTETKITG